MKALAQNTLIQNRYLIVHLIGKGGMGEVYLAVDQRLGSAVALKRTFFAGDDMLGSAFEREARTLARMRHPVLPKVSDHFGENDEQYLVMEHIAGEDLAKRLEAAQKPFPISWVLFWADQLLDALSYLHTHEPPIIHRDIKPQNLKLTDENHIILLDFGLSKTSTGQTNLTEHGSTGSVVGYTPHYASMEQIRGIGTSARSDLYSLSATLYQLMTNTVPADALSRADAMLNEMPDPIQHPSEINPEVPAHVSDVILRGMEVSQERRYANAREMQKVLRKAFTEMQQATTAETVAFNYQNERMNAIDQPVAALAQADVLVLDKINQSGGQAHHSGRGAYPSGGLSGNNAAGEEDFDATINVDYLSEADSLESFDSQSGANSLKQADVKTEVFLGTSLPSADNQGSTPFSESSKQAEPTTADNVFETNDFSSAGPDSAARGYSPDSTAPYVSLEGDAAADFSNGRETPEFYNERQSRLSAFEAASTPYFEPPPPENETRSEIMPHQPAPTARSAKKSSTKVFAVLGGLAALLVLGALATGGGLYYYANYYSVANTSEPAASPEMSVEPSPEPTFESARDATNSESRDSGILSETNTNSRAEDITVAPTPARTPFAETIPRQTPIPARTARPTQQSLPRNTTSKPPGGKPTPTPKPKPKKTDDRTKILQ